jgi:hypothetical protein
MQMSQLMRQELRAHRDEARQDLDTAITDLRTSITGEITSVRNEVTSLSTRVDAQQAELESLREELRSHASLREDLLGEVDRRVTALGRPPAGAPPAPPAVFPPPGQPGAFVAKRVFLKGWSIYKKEESMGLNSKACAHIVSSVAPLLPKEWHRYIAFDQAYHPGRRNTQISLPIKDGAPDDAAREICRIWNAALREQNIRYNGRDIFVQPDAEPWVKARRASLARARDTAEAELDLPLHTVDPEWSSGKLYATSADGTEVLLGAWSLKKGWSWQAENVQRLDAKADVAALDLAMLA